jgi:hypothetical protein
MEKSSIIIGYIKFLIESLQQRYVDLEVFVVVADIYESPEKFVRED